MLNQFVVHHTGRSRKSVNSVRTSEHKRSSCNIPDRMHQATGRRTKKEKKKRPRGAERQVSDVTRMSLKGQRITLALFGTRAGNSALTPGTRGGRGRTAVPRKESVAGFTTESRREAHRTLKILDVPDQPRGRVRQTTPPS